MKILYRFLIVVMLVFPAVSFIGAGEAYAVDWIDDDPSGKDDFFEETETRIKDTAASLYACVLVCVISCGAIAILVTAMMLARKNPQIREEAKERLIHICIGLAAVFSIALIASVAAMIGSHLVF